MKVLLINPPYLSIYGPDRGAVKSHFPLGLGYVASYLIKNGFGVSYLDPEAEGLNIASIRERLKRTAPDLVGVTSTTPTFKSAMDVASLVREELDCPIALGGPHASVLPEYTIEKYHSLFDCMVVGEGESTMLELCAALQGGEDFSAVRGLCSLSNGRAFFAGKREGIEDLDDIPMPAREIADMELYAEPNDFNSVGKKAATMFTSRACPYECVFCASRSIWGRKVRYHSPERVIEEIRLLHERYKVEHILFKDDTLGLKRERVVDICEGIIRYGKKLYFSCLARVDSLDEDLLALMKRAGFFHVCFGIESGNDEIMKNLKKGITKDEARRTLKSANKLGFKTFCTFMIGNPGDTRQTVRDTIRFAVELNPTIALFYILVPYPGTEIFDKRIGLEGLEGLDWEDFVISKGSLVADAENLSASEMRKLLRTAYLTFYLRPRALWNILKQFKDLNYIRAYFRGGIGLFKRLISL